MRAVVITKYGAPGVLKVEERPEPVAGPGEVVIDVASAGVNFADVMARLGFYADAPKAPCIVGYEVAGTVSELGEGVTELALGDRVAAATRFGGQAERVVVNAAHTMRIPDANSFSEAAAVPVNYSTAWAGLVRYGNLQPGERVLIHAAAGGVGIAATQVARQLGAEIYGTASPQKHSHLQLDHVLDYTKKGWQDGLPKFDIVMDAIGGKSFRNSYNMLAPGGRLVCYGASSVVGGERRNFVTALRTLAQMPRFSMVKQMTQSKAIIGLNMLTLWDAAGSLDPWMQPVNAMLAAGTIKPVIAEEFSFEHAGDAHRLLSSRGNIGKVILTPR